MKTLLFIAILLTQFQITNRISLGCFVALTLFTMIKVFLSGKEISKKWVSYCFLWVLMMVFMSRAEFIYLDETKAELLWLSLGLMSLFIISANESIDRLKLLNYVVFAGVLGALVNVFSYLTEWYPSWLIQAPYAGTRWVGGFDGPNEVSAFYVMIMALILGLYIEKEYSALKTIMLFAVVSPMAYLGFSRGALMGLAGLLVIFAIYSIIKSRHKVILLGFYSVATWVFIDRFYEYLYVKFNETRQNASERDSLFIESFSLFKERPIIGHGFGSFGELANVANEVPHSDYLLFLVSGGIIGISFLLIFYFNLLVSSFKRKYYPELFLLLVFMSQAMTFNNIIRGRLSILFWVIVILIYLGKKVERVEKVLPKKPLFKMRRITW